MNICGTEQIIRVPEIYPSAKVTKVKCRRHQCVTPSTIICVLKVDGHPDAAIQSPGYGKITMLCKENSLLKAKEGGVCGERITAASASIPMVHTIPDLHVSESVAAKIALQDEQGLLASRKLALLIDLDQTVLHTTTTQNAFRYKDVQRFRLAGCPMIYHTRFRPHLTRFFQKMVKRFQMHICTFGNRAYAHQLASMLDPTSEYFCQRILSRDECFNPATKSANLKALFPRGVHLVCIIDDRGDVWDWSPNLIQVQPYRFFPEVGDINAPPGRPVSILPMPDFRVMTPPSVASSGSSQAIDLPAPKKPKQVGATGTENVGAIPIAGATNGNLQPAEGQSVHTDTKYECQKLLSPPETPPQPPPQQQVNAQQQQSIFDMTEEELDAFDGEYLLRLEQILIEIHRRYYRAYDKMMSKISNLGPDTTANPRHYRGIPHVANIMSEMRSRVLDRDVHITLSGLTPTHRPASDCLAGQIALSLGATLHNRLRLPTSQHTQPNPPHPPPPPSTTADTSCGSGGSAQPTSRGQYYTTHLVACRQFTEKVAAATAHKQKMMTTSTSSRRNLHIVSPRWLWYSHFRWQRLPECQFPLTQDYSLGTFDPDAPYCAPRGLYRSYRHHKNRSDSPRDPFETVVSQPEVAVEKPNLNASMVRAAIESIKEEEEERQSSHRRRRANSGSERQGNTNNSHKRTLSESSVGCAVVSNKRACTRRSDGHLSAAEELDEAVVEEEDRASDAGGDAAELPRSRLTKKPPSVSPSLSADESDTEQDIESIAPSAPPPTPPSLPPTTTTTTAEDDFLLTEKVDIDPFASLTSTETESNDPDDVTVISDADEDDLESTIADDEERARDLEEDSELDEKREAEEVASIREEMKQYLPPPCPLELADNPLLHMSPEATNEMLEEIREAVLEEREERAASVPPETELNSDNDDSSSSSSPPVDTPGTHSTRKTILNLSASSIEEEDKEDEYFYVDEDFGDDGEDLSSSRRRNRVSKELEQEERCLQIRQLLLRRKKGANNRRLLAAVEKRLREIRREEGEEDDEVEDYQVFRPIPIIRANPQPQQRRSDWPDVALTDDAREFNTCPEGYDYADAERARELLRPEKRVDSSKDGKKKKKKKTVRTKHSRRRLPKSAKEEVKKKRKHVIGAAGYLEASLFGSDSSSSSSSSEDGEDDDEGGGAGGGRFVIHSSALKEFM